MKCNLYQKQYLILEKLTPATSMNSLMAYCKFKKKVDSITLFDVIKETIEQIPYLSLMINSKDELYYKKVDDAEKQGLIKRLNFNNIRDYKKWEEEYKHSPIPVFDHYYFQVNVIDINEETIIYGKVQHILYDGITVNKVLHIILNNYIKRLQGKKFQFSYEDDSTEILAADDKYLNSNRYLKDKEYWHKKEVYASKFSNMEKRIEGKRIEVNLNKEITKETEELCRKESLSPYAFFESILAITVRKYFYDNNVAIGAVLHNREKRFMNSMSMFVNVLPVCIKINEEDSYRELYDKVKKENIKCFRHVKYPLMQTLTKPMDVLFSYQVNEVKLNDIDVKWTYSNETSVPLVVSMSHIYNEGEYVVDIDYMKSCFSEEEVKKLIDDFKDNIIKAVKQFG